MRALALLSGGLDSMLAVQLLLQQGIHVEGVNFFTGFCGVGSNFKETYDAQWVAKRLGIKLHVVNVVEEFKAVLLKPRYGYGAHLNPCLDCKIFMVRAGLLWMQQHGFDFLLSGEVVGQRPMSQRKDTLPLIAQEASELLLRPLSAQLLLPTLPEKAGWVQRELLCGMSGRSRKPQIALAKQFGFTEYPQPAGGCWLTEAIFTHRLQDFWQQHGQDYNLRDLTLLKLGRHLRIHGCKIIVGRNAIENQQLAAYTEYPRMYSTSHVGPMVLLDSWPSPQSAPLIAQVTASFGKGKHADLVTVLLEGATTQELVVTPIPAIDPNWYLC